MNRQFGALVIAALGYAMALLVGCAGIQPYEPPPSTEVPLTSFGPVAGKWSGLLRTEPRVNKEDWVKVTIGDDGSYSFASYRVIGVFQGKGTFRLANGKLTEEFDQGRITGRLYEEGDKRMLKFDATAKDGTQYAAELTPEK